MSTREEIKSLTSLRGVAATLVVIYHFRGQFGADLNLDRYTHFFECSWLWVDFFFALSGFVMTYVYAGMFEDAVTPRPYGEFMVRRLARVYPLHLFMLACFVPTEISKFFVNANAEPPFSNNSVSAIATNALLVQAWGIHQDVTWNRASWSISAELAAYILFPFLAAFLLRRRAWQLLAVALLSYAALICLEKAAGRGTLHLTYDYGVLRALPTFIIGMVMGRWYLSPPDPIKKWLSRDVVTGLALIGVIASMHVGASDFLIIGLMCVLVMSASMNTSRVSRSLSVSPLYTLGLLSYSIYMTHGLVQRVWQFVFQKILHAHVDTPVAIGLLMTIVAVVVGISWFTYKYVEAPGRRTLNRYATRLRSGARAFPHTVA